MCRPVSRDIKKNNDWTRWGVGRKERAALKERPVEIGGWSHRKQRSRWCLNSKFWSLDGAEETVTLLQQRQPRREHPERKSWALGKSSRISTRLHCPWDTEGRSHGDGGQKAGQGLKLEILEHWLECVGFPGGTGGKEHTCQCRRWKRRGFDPWVGKIPWRRAWQPTLVFLPGESHGQRSLVGYSPWGPTELDTTEWLSTLSVSKIFKKGKN